MKHIFDSTLLVVDDNKELCRMVEGILQFLTLICRMETDFP